ncbi:LptF/LptG family permease [Fusobacterium perfoetens]|uniref:LptF/LptG family permease n=1 Tax=Fusobacterium perfoetens TaxID=852 RepID=UPI000480A420|nr:LptF/LptG family permease [Fusobacterium perfoetens]
MKIINDYILKETKMSIVFGITLFTFIFLIEMIVSMMESILVRGLSIIDVSRMISFYLPMILSQTIPMGIFLGIMITFGNLTRNNEITALNSMGVSLNKLLKPIIGIGVVGTIFIFFLQESLIPRSYIKLQQISYKMIYENPVFQLKDRVLIDGISEYKIYIDSINKKTKDAENVLVMINDKKSEYPTLVLGKTAYWEDAALLLNDADFYKHDEKGNVSVTGNFEKKRVPFTSYFEDIKVKIKDIEGMNIKQLLSEIKTRDKIEILPYIVEINRKIAVPISTIALAILGVLLSIGNARTGKGVNFGIGIIVIFLYIVLLNIGMVLAYRSIISPFLGVWFPNIVLYIYTLFLYSRKVRLV